MPLELDRSNSDLVLIVDDVPENLSVLHDALDESGFTVLVAISGEAALARARQGLPDIILLDAMMPGMDGFEVARRLKADFSTRHIPIIFMTGLTETEHVDACLQFRGLGLCQQTGAHRRGDRAHPHPFAERPTDEAGEERARCLRTGGAGREPGVRAHHLADAAGEPACSAAISATPASTHPPRCSSGSPPAPHPPR